MSATQDSDTTEVTTIVASYDAHNIPHPRKRAFLAAYSVAANISEACRQAGVHRRTHYDWLERDDEYAAAVEEAYAEAIERMEREAYRRAIEGYEHPVWYQGEQVGTERRFSDNLAMFLLKGAKPEKYRDNARVEVSGAVAHAHVHASADEESRLMGLLRGGRDAVEGEQAKQVESRPAGESEGDGDG